MCISPALGLALKKQVHFYTEKCDSPLDFAPAKTFTFCWTVDVKLVKVFLRQEPTETIFLLFGQKVTRKLTRVNERYRGFINS